jgi:hypothetical protein
MPASTPSFVKTLRNLRRQRRFELGSAPLPAWRLTMTGSSSRDFGEEPHRKDTKREQKKAILKDADQTETKDWDAIHGDGSSLGMDNRKTGSSKRD